MPIPSAPAGTKVRSLESLYEFLETSFAKVTNNQHAIEHVAVLQGAMLVLIRHVAELQNANNSK